MEELSDDETASAGRNWHLWGAGPGRADHVDAVPGIHDAGEHPGAHAERHCGRLPGAGADLRAAHRRDRFVRGSNIALTGMLAAISMQMGAPWWLAAIVALVAGLLVGLFNGSIIHFVRLPPFIVTFSTFGIAAAIPQIITGAKSVTVADPMFAIFGRGSLFGIPIPVLLLAVATVVFMVVLKQTPAASTSTPWAATSTPADWPASTSDARS